MYLFDHYVCFYSNIFGYEKKVRQKVHPLLYARYIFGLFKVQVLMHGVRL